MCHMVVSHICGLLVFLRRDSSARALREAGLRRLAPLLCRDFRARLGENRFSLDSVRESSSRVPSVPKGMKPAMVNRSPHVWLIRWRNTALTSSTRRGVQFRNIFMKAWYERAGTFPP